MDSNGLDLLWDHYQLEGHTGHLGKSTTWLPDQVLICLLLVEAGSHFAKGIIHLVLLRLFRNCVILTLSTSSRGPLRKRKNQILSSEWGKLFVKKLAVT